MLFLRFLEVFHAFWGFSYYFLTIFLGFLRFFYAFSFLPPQEELPKVVLACAEAICDASEAFLRALGGEHGEGATWVGWKVFGRRFCCCFFLWFLDYFLLFLMVFGLFADSTSQQSTPVLNSIPSRLFCCCCCFWGWFLDTWWPFCGLMKVF